MTITIDGVELSLSAEYAEYISLMKTAVVKPGEPPVASDAEMIQKILADNYSANIKQHAAVRPKAVAAKIKAIEDAATAVFDESTLGAVTGKP